SPRIRNQIRLAGFWAGGLDLQSVSVPPGGHGNWSWRRGDDSITFRVWRGKARQGKLGIARGTRTHAQQAGLMIIDGQGAPSVTKTAGEIEIRASRGGFPKRGGSA